MEQNDIQKTINNLPLKCYSNYDEDKVDEELKCSVEFGFISQPYSVPCCGKFFCKNCLYESVKNNKRCPYCNTPLKEDQISEEKNLFVKKQINKQIIKCNQDCEWEGKFEEFIAHLNTHQQCQFCQENKIKWQKEKNILEEKIQENQKQLEEKNTKIHEYHKQLEEKNLKIQQKEIQLKNSINQIQLKEIQLQQTNSKIQDYQEQLEEKNQKIQELYKHKPQCKQQ